MLICIDFDGTYTMDLPLWDAFIEKARNNGHEVICATMRYEHEMGYVYQKLEGKVDRIIHTSRKAKKPFLQTEGIIPDVWIDDNPEWLFKDSI